MAAQGVCLEHGCADACVCLKRKQHASQGLLSPTHPTTLSPTHPSAEHPTHIRCHSTSCRSPLPHAPALCLPAAAAPPPTTAAAAATAAAAPAAPPSQCPGAARIPAALRATATRLPAAVQPAATPVARAREPLGRDHSHVRRCWPRGAAVHARLPQLRYRATAAAAGTHSKGHRA